jgi:L-2-hydroxyglutarate oxidase
VVIGGGIVGLSVTWAILQHLLRARLAVLEKENDWPRHQTGQNSGVIYSGIYYKPCILKARLCREDNHRILEFCRTHEVPHKICGKVTVASSQTEFPMLERLYTRSAPMKHPCGFLFEAPGQLYPVERLVPSKVWTP